MSVRAKHALLCLPALVAPLFLPLLLREQILVGVVPHTHSLCWLTVVHASSIGAYPLSSFQEEHTLEPELGPREARDFHASTINDLQFCNGYSC